MQVAINEQITHKDILVPVDACITADIVAVADLNWEDMGKRRRSNFGGRT